MSTLLHEKDFNSAWIETQLGIAIKTLYVEPIIMRNIWLGDVK